jgi:hypothetical protein
MAAILGILKTGQYYVPLHAWHPDDVNSGWIEPSGAAAVVSSPGRAGQARRPAGPVSTRLEVD